MNPFIWNLILAAIWAFARGELSLANLLVGFAIGYVMLLLGQSLIGAKEYCARVPSLVNLLLFLLWKLLLANFRVACDVVTPRHRMRPGIIALPLDAKTDTEILILAGIISLTPGTLTIDVSPDRQFLYVHSMYIQDIEAEKASLKAGFERRILEVTR